MVEQQSSDAPIGAPLDWRDADRVNEAQRALVDAGEIQFALPDAPPPPPDPPGWLKSLFDFLFGLGSFWQVLFWALVTAAVIALLFVFVPSLRDWAAAMIGRRRGVDDDEQGEAPRWVPDRSDARTLLADADRLAADGEYDAAVHLILLRSIADIERWRSGLVRPSLTARDIASSEDLPDRARGVFARIVASVERSLFARRALGAPDWERARADYADFALGHTGTSTS